MTNSNIGVPIDLRILELLHYFITEENYNPIIVQGVQDEIWLENLENNYKVIRIVTHYIHNNEQFNLDMHKSSRIRKNLKTKTMSLKMKVLNIYTSLGESVELHSEKDIECVAIKEKESAVNNKTMLEVFPNLSKNTLKNKEEGMELFLKITTDINKKTFENNIKAEKLFRKKQPIVTYLLIIINIVMFVLMYALGNGSTNTKTLIDFGALIKDGEYFRIFTCAFLHIGIWHLLINMYSLYIIGSQVESFYGKIKFLIIYLVSAISGSLLSLAFLPIDGFSAGASGAIFGLLGAILYFGYHYRVYLGNVIKSQIIPIILINLSFGFINDHIDNAAHIGGLLGGLVCGMALGVSDKTKKFERVNGFIILAIYIAFLVYLAFFSNI